MGIHSTPKVRRAGLGKLLNTLLELQHPDPVAELIASLGVEASVTRERFVEFGQDYEPQGSPPTADSRTN